MKTYRAETIYTSDEVGSVWDDGVKIDGPPGEYVPAEVAEELLAACEQLVAAVKRGEVLDRHVWNADAAVAKAKDTTP